MVAGGDVPDFGARLRRARLGLICGIATVCMVFISLTSAYVLRQGLPTFDGARILMSATGAASICRWLLLVINTRALAGQQRDHGICAAAGGKASGAGSGEVDSRSLAGGREELFPGWGLRCCWVFVFSPASGWRGENCIMRGFYVDTNPSSSFVFLLTTDARGASGRWDDCVALGGERFPAAQAA